jgi:acyl-CoA reductase-like NAD-dependent aldehyde dehydrogenase
MMGASICSSESPWTHVSAALGHLQVSAVALGPDGNLYSLDRAGRRVVDEEQFGPIMPIIRYEDEDEALALANANPYGLGGSVWSNDLARAHAIAAKLECGQAWINKHGVAPAEFPLSGAKQSGFGVELGDEGLRSYTQMTVVCD